jgi:hypothetical protein
MKVVGLMAATSCVFSAWDVARYVFHLTMLAPMAQLLLAI